MPIHSKKNHRTLLSLAVASALAGGQAVAEEHPALQENDDNALEILVIVGSTTNREITSAELEKQQASDLADVFRYVPAVSVGGSLGIAQKVYIRGMEDTLLNITVDGAPQTGTLFHHIGRVSIEPELLDKVEVQAGAGEATSGAGAIGGAIRFKTKNAADLLDADQRFGALLKASTFTNDGEKLSASLFGRLSDDWSLLASYVDVDRDNMEDGDGNELFGTSAEQSLAFVKLGGQISANQSLTLSYEQREESGEFGARPNWPTLEGDTLFPIDAERRTIVLNHSLQTGGKLNLETTLYSTESEIIQDRFDRWGKYQATVASTGFDIRNTSIFGQHTFTYGVDWRNDTVESQYLAPDAVWQDWAWDPAIRVVEEEGQVMGLYAQDHWQVSDPLLISFGVRYDSYDLEQVTYGSETDSSAISPNIGLRYAVSDEVTFTIGHARAMRGKEIGDAFTIERDPAEPSLQANLEPEKVQNSEVGIEYNGDYLALSASYYQSTIDDVILDQIGRGVFYENVGELETQGFELIAAYEWDNLYLSASYSQNESELNGDTVEGYEHNGLANERGNTWNLSANYTFASQFELGWNFVYVEDLNNIEVLQRAVELGWIDSTQTVDKPSYQVHDIYLRWTPFDDDSLALNLAVQNVFDEQYRDHSSVAAYNSIPGWEGVAGLYEPGRDIRASIRYQF